MSNRLDDFFRQFKKIHYRKGATIIRSGDEPAGISYVVDGYVRMYSIFEDGRELTHNIYQPGSFFPIIWGLSDLGNEYFFQSIAPVDVYLAPIEKVIDHLKNNPDDLIALVKRFTIGVNALLTNSEYLLFGFASQRITSALIVLSRRFGKKDNGGGAIITLPLTHQIIASMVGVSRETASIEIKRLERNSSIYRRRRLYIIRNLRQLEQQVSLHKKESALPPSI